MRKKTRKTTPTFPSYTGKNSKRVTKQQKKEGNGRRDEICGQFGLEIEENNRDDRLVRSGDRYAVSFVGWSEHCLNRRDLKWMNEDNVD